MFSMLSCLLEANLVDLTVATITMGNVQEVLEVAAARVEWRSQGKGTFPAALPSFAALWP